MTQNNIIELLKQLETHEFSAQINVCSDLICVERAIFSSEVVREIVKLCKKDPLVIEAILERTRHLGNIAIDVRYESPWDIAFAAHLLILRVADQDAAFTAASLVSNARNTWWAVKIADAIFFPQRYASKKTDRTEEIVAEYLLDQRTWLKHVPQLSSYGVLSFEQNCHLTIGNFHSKWRFKIARSNVVNSQIISNFDPTDSGVPEAWLSREVIISVNSASSICEGT